MLAPSSETSVVRQARPRDLPQLAAFVGKNRSWVARVATDLWRRQRHITIAEQRGMLVGMLDVQVQQLGSEPGFVGNVCQRVLGVPRPKRDSILRQVTWGHIRGLRIPDARREEEIMQSLIDGAVIPLQEHGVLELQTPIPSHDHERIESWRQLGFEPTQYMLSLADPKATTAIRGELSYSRAGTIRPATNDDLARLRRLIRKQVESQLAFSRLLQLRTGVNWHRYTTDKLKCRHTVLLVAEEAERLLGYVETRRLDDHANARRWRVNRRICASGSSAIKAAPKSVIEDIYVEPERRNEGLACALVAHATQFVGGRILASVWSQNRASLNLFRKLGFERSQETLSRQFANWRQDQPASIGKYVAVDDSQLSGDVDGETVILNIKDGVYYGLSGVGPRVWQLLQRPRSIDELVDMLADEYSVERDQCRHDVSRLLEGMSSSGLVTAYREQIE